MLCKNCSEGKTPESTAQAVSALVVCQDYYERCERCQAVLGWDEVETRPSAENARPLFHRCNG